MDRNPVAETIPVWYEIGMMNASTIAIRVHKQAMAQVRAIEWEKMPICRCLQKALSLGKFIPPSEARWGFDSTIISQKELDPKWERFHCTLPLILTEEPATNKMRQGQIDALTLRASLSCFFMALSFFDGNTAEKQPQLLVIDNFLVDYGLHGGSLSASITPALCQWLAQQPEESRLTETEDAMQAANHHMWPLSGSYHRELVALCRQPKWVNFTVPGNACGLDPENYYDQSLDRGYRLAPHNVDGSPQQLALLVGLAKLHDLARKMPMLDTNVKPC